VASGTEHGESSSDEVPYADSGRHDRPPPVQAGLPDVAAYLANAVATGVIGTVISADAVKRRATSLMRRVCRRGTSGPSEREAKALAQTAVALQYGVSSTAVGGVSRQEDGSWTVEVHDASQGFAVSVPARPRDLEDIGIARWNKLD
jgi:hypothetical protein